MSAAQARVRRGDAADVETVIALEWATERAPHWPRAAYEAVVNEADRRCLFVAEIDGEVVGFAVGAVGSGPHSGGREGEIESVAVAERARRAGTGRRLCEAILAWCGAQGATEVALEVRAGSADAIALYAGLGFVRVGTRPRYYQQPEEDAVLMRMKLAPGGSSA